MTSEKLLGDVLKGKREQVVLLTKCGAVDGFSRSDWSKAGIVQTIEQSLKNLQTDYLDVVFLHSCGELEFLWGEAAEGLKAAKEKGYIRFLGYSGDSASALSAVESDIFDVLETSISIADQEVLTLVLPKAREKNMGVVAKRPIANAAWRYAKKPENAYHEPYWQRLQKLNYPFLKDAGNAAAEIALRFTLFQPGVHTAIVGTTNPERFSLNAAAAKKGALPENQLQEIRSTWQKVAEPGWVGKI